MEKYTIIRTHRRTLALEVRQDGTVVVRAPGGCSDAAIGAFVARHETWLARALARRTAERAARPEPTEAERAALIARAKELLPQKVAYYAAQMGVAPTGVKITSARTRFGSCSGKNSLCFSWRLIRYPDEAVDCVVVHELAHIRHKNHGKAFYAFIDRFMPDYAARRQLLR